MPETNAKKVKVEAPEQAAVRREKDAKRKQKERDRKKASMAGGMDIDRGRWRGHTQSNDGYERPVPESGSLVR